MPNNQDYIQQEMTFPELNPAIPFGVDEPSIDFNLRWPELNPSIPVAQDEADIEFRNAFPELNPNIPVAPDESAVEFRVNFPELNPVVPVAPDEATGELLPLPLRGGAVTVRDKGLLSSGAFSLIQNLRGTHPGFEKRTGMRKQHATADSTNRVETVHQFVKRQISETHTFAQMSDADILEADTAPPGVDSGVFGDEVFTSALSGHRPAAWGAVADILIHSNGADPHKYYVGTANYVKKFVKWDSDAAPAHVPNIGNDYTDQVTDGDSSTVAVLDSLATYVAGDCIFICTPLPANCLTWTVSAVNANPATGSLMYYRGSDNTWQDTTETDLTVTGGDTTLGQSGIMHWNPPADEIPKWQYGVYGYWYQWRTSATLDAEVEVSQVTYGTDHDAAGTRVSFLDLKNVWDGVLIDLIEAQVSNSAGLVYTYGSGAVDLGTPEFDENDTLFLASTEPLSGLYVDPGNTPNTDTTSAADISDIKYYNGTAWVALTTITDETIRGSSTTFTGPGFITWVRPAAGAEQPSCLASTEYYAYWYLVKLDDAVSTDVVLSIQGMPYYDIDELGKGVANCAWQDRMCYAFDRWGQYIHVSKRDNPEVLNGPDYGVLEAGDGRANQVLSMGRYYNEMIAWQEEKGVEGGCTTIFEGYNPSTFGKLILSTKVGIMNSKSHAIIDGVLTSTATEEKIKTLAFWLSRYGVIASDGRSLTAISDDIQNYFDPTKTECVRRGCEAQHWLAHDSSDNVLRIGLVSGEPIQTSAATSTSGSKLVDTAGAFTTRKIVTGHPISAWVSIGDTVYNTTDDTTALVTAVDSATQLSIDTDIMASGESYQILSHAPNLFPVFDLTDKAWSFDLYQNNLSCMTEVEAGSGQTTVIQLGGGVGKEPNGYDSHVFHLNYGLDDVATPINSYFDMEIDAGGEMLNLSELLVRCKVQDAGNISATIYDNDVSDTTATLAMTEVVSGDAIRRHRSKMNVLSHHPTIRLQHNTAAEDMYLYSLAAQLVRMCER